MAAEMTSTSRRLLGGATAVIFVKLALPICRPHDPNDVPLADNDTFVIATRKIAHRTGLLHPENLRVYVSSGGETGGSIGANLRWLNRSSICVSDMVYESFFAKTPCDEALTRDEVEFILAHECTHLAKNHPLSMASFVPPSMLSSVMVARRLASRSRAGAALVSVGLLALSGMGLSWRMEYEADHGAAALGASYRSGGVDMLERTRRQNCMLKQMWPTRLITDEGNYLADTAHPWLTSRIRHLELLNQLESTTACAFCSTF
ncbi:hypothetical protein Ae201684P_017902 [Aphanomyces euteiches]|uniref:Peptidase M48 domain-containing protein n=1 Tax=Aphanomyces euteiches TaxID=100861 RepID=A0A6G0XN81_9STRA|nr:hypothetical protein Ae201684_003046 [Aphanomyces euteiches]KAH9098691.1 hypothetical protein Ae201684P_017902 [Aphanomyces euteiches]